MDAGNQRIIDGFNEKGSESLKPLARIKEA